MNLSYHSGYRGRKETIEYEVKSSLYVNTVCVINVDRLLHSINRFPCGSGEDHRLSPKERLAILQFLKAEREKIRDSGEEKSLFQWENSGLNLHEYLAAGDTVDRDMIDYVIGVMQPQSLRADYVQMGDPVSHVREKESGLHQPVYYTFAKEGERWTYSGVCFEGGTAPACDMRSYLNDAIAAAQKQLNKREKSSFER